MPTKLFYNPRCSKSREALQLLEDRDETTEIVKYLDDPPGKKKLEQILQLLGIAPIELVRTKESEWKKNFKGEDLSDDQIIEVMVEYPKLIERPIAIKNQQAIIGRPPEKVLEIL